MTGHASGFALRLASDGERGEDGMRATCRPFATAPRPANSPCAASPLLAVRTLDPERVSDAKCNGQRSDRA